MAFDKKEYDANFQKNNYDRVVFKIGKGRHQELKEYAATQDKSVNALVLEALWKCYRLDLKTPVERPEE